LADLALTDYGGSVYEEAVVHTVIETPAFLASAADEGISEEERTAMVAYIAAHPTAGEIIKGTGGARKLRFAGRGKGKSGGYRVITFHADEDIPVFLLDVYAKDSQANLSKAQRNELRKLLTALPRVWRQHRAARRAELRGRQ
jgi:hypothetical protein